jgi:hypothetical protein
LPHLFNKVSSDNTKTQDSYKFLAAKTQSRKLALAEGLSGLQIVYSD